MKHNGIEIREMIHDNHPVKTWIHDGKIVFALCTVTFVDWDNTILNTQTIPYGGSATKPANPYRSGYTFTGWSGSYTNVTSDVTITAKYYKNSVTPPTTYYTVTFVDHDGTELHKDPNVPSGGSATPPSDPERYGYTFIGWSGSYTNVTADVTITATYSKTVYQDSMFAVSGRYGMVSYLIINPSNVSPVPTTIISATAASTLQQDSITHNAVSTVAYGLPREYEGETSFGLSFEIESAIDPFIEHPTQTLVTIKYYIV